MSYADSKDVIGKQPITIVGLVVDKCSLTYGVSPCTAEVGVTGSQKCFNTRKTCQDPANYDRTTTEVKFCQPRSNLPVGETMIPAISGDVRIAPSSVTAGKGLGNRSVVKVRINDFRHHDRGFDPYWTERTYNPEEQGTFWGKWLSRNPYYEGRTLKIYYGYINSPFSLTDFELREYDITDIQGPNDGEVVITAKDILIRTYKEKAQYPAKSNGKLDADITAADTTATLSPAGVGDDEYPASGTVSISKEAMAFTRSGDTLTLTRAQWGTEAKEHKADDEVQICKTWSDVNIVDVLEELLVTGAGLPPAYIPYDNGATGTNENWDNEKKLWLSTSLATGILMKPDKINEVIAELSEQFMFDVWWEAKEQKVKIKALSPEPSGATVSTLTEGYNILKDSLSIKRDAKQRITQIQVWYRKTDYSEKDDIEFFSAAHVTADVAAAGANKYGSDSIKVVTSRWINSSAQAAQLAGRLLARFVESPEIIEFEVASKDDAQFETAGRIEIDSWQFQDFTGANEPRKFQVLEIDETEPGHKVRVSALTSSFSGNYWFIAPDGTPDYSSADADQQAKYAWICPDSGVFVDGTKGYKII